MRRRCQNPVRFPLGARPRLAVPGRIAIRRSQFAQELQAGVERQGGSAQDSGSVAASLHRGWIALASSVSHGDARAIVASCEAGEGAARASYEEVLSSWISGNTRALIETQWKAIERAQQEMQHLQNQMAAGQRPERD